MKQWRVVVYGLGLLLLIALAFYIVKSWPAVDSAKTGIDQSLGQVQSAGNPIKLNAEEFRLPEKVNPRGLNLIFLADQYQSWDEFGNDINFLMEELKTIEPWQSYQFFNIYEINPKEIGLCYIKIKDERKPALRCSPEINKYLNTLPLEKFRLIVLSRQEFQSWANITRYENSGIFFSMPHALTEKTDQRVNALLFAHLLGHAFGLKDEEIFVLAKAGGAPHTPDGPNCAPDVATAEKWWGDLAKKYREVGYFKGCNGNENYIKPTQASIMNLNTGAPIVYNYGSVSERYLNKVLDYCFSDKQHKVSDDPAFFTAYSDFVACVK